MTPQGAVAFLDSLTNYERRHQPQAMQRIRLERMRLLCERLGHPQTSFRSILVAGTNGKGSICAMIYEILRHTHLRIGLYTSPHLEDVRERIRVNVECACLPLVQRGRQGMRSAELQGDRADWISEEGFAASIDHIRSVLEENRDLSGHGGPTYFEVLTAAAFEHFAQQRVDVAILEVGLGGRLDATNVVEQAVSVLGPIGLDHTDVLGEDLVAIAREKTGIIKPKQIVVSALQEPEVSALLGDVASQQGCRLIEYGRHLFADILAHGPSGLRVSIRSPRGQYDQLSIPLLGRHQAANAAVAIAAVESLSEAGVPHAAVRSGLAQIRWPGRLEVIREQPLVVFDGAHNLQAAQALRATLEELWPRRAPHVLIGMSADKPVQAVGEILGPMAASITCTKSRHPRACDPQRLAEQLKSSTQHIAVISDAADAYTYLLNTAGPNELVVVTGSLFLVGELRAPRDLESLRR